MQAKKQLSSSLEDYLKEIYILSNTKRHVRVTDVAATLGISKASVNKAINALKEMDYLEHEHYGTIQLTEEGKEIAEGIIETYKVSYKFLAEVLGVDKSEAEKEAHQMEHILSKSTKKKLKKFNKKQKK